MDTLKEEAVSERLAKGVLSLSKLKWEVGSDGRRRRKPGSSDAAPDYFGTMAAEVGGAQDGQSVKLRLAGWARKGKKTGLPYMEIVLECDRDEVRRLTLALPAASETPRSLDGETGDDLDDLPF